MTNTTQKQQSVIVTGAANGIGRACTQYLLEKGHRVLAVDLMVNQLETAFPDAPKNLAFHSADVSNPEDCNNLVIAASSLFGKIDALIHWAGIHSMKTWDTLSKEDLDQVLSVNISGAFLVAQAAAKAMRETGGGSIVLTGSTSVIHGATGEIEGTGGPGYVASKAAMTGLIRSMANSLGRYQIRVNGVVPGATLTPMTQNYTQETRDVLAAMSPLGHIASPEEIAEVGCFLITHEARYVSGESIIVNGASSFG